MVTPQHGLDAHAAGPEAERIVPGTAVWDASFPDHIQRYRFAAALIPEGGIVLDAGCGAGYGAAELAASRNARVVAVDIAADALALARAHFDRPDITWCRDDCHTLGQAAAHGPFDVIVNFENIEHLRHPARFVARAADLLRADGILIASTPNRVLINRARGAPDDAPSVNPYHVNELSETEFRELLERHFEHVEMRYQCLRGAAGRRLTLRTIAARTGLLPALRALRRAVNAVVRRDAGRVSTLGDVAWTIEERDCGTAWTLIAICTRPRDAQPG
jgi:SAM-dependent methyltransferase